MAKNIGKPKPKSAPSWYRSRPPSYIENEFTKELGDFANLIESEVWFGDQSNHFRYRVDFILIDARLIIELDGHEYHSSPEQLRKDAQRQRYLTRAGFTVIRFTGSEIVDNCAECVLDVRNIYRERMQRNPDKYRVMYIDYPFIFRETEKFLNFHKKLQKNGDVPERVLTSVSLDELLPYAIEWLHEKSHIAAIVFYPPEYEDAIKHLDLTSKQYSKGSIVISLIKDELYSLKLGEHMKSFSHLFDEFMLVGDDTVYIEPLRSVLPSMLTEKEVGASNFEYLANAKLLRLGNEDTVYVYSDLVHVKWQRLYYVIGASMGLNLYEM